METKAPLQALDQPAGREVTADVGRDLREVAASEANEIRVMERHLPRGYHAKAASLPHYELRYVQSGAGTLHSGPLKLRFRPGDLIFVPPHSEERVEIAEDNPPKFYLLSFEYSIIADLQSCPKAWQGLRLFPQSGFGSEFVSTLRDCLYEKALGRPGWSRYILGRGQLLIINFFRLILLRGRVTESHISRADLAQVRVTEYIRRLDMDFYQVDSLECVADRLGMSTRHFSKIFRRITGMTWLRYIHALRIRHAKNLLEGTGDTVNAIAFQCGFEEATTFYRIFKSEEGVSPGAWRDTRRSQRDLPREGSFQG